MSYDTPYQQKDNSGSIFRNDKKLSETHPDGKGSCVVDGVEYWISSWTKTDRNGKQYRSLSFQRKEQPASVPQTRQAPRPAPPRQAPKGSQGSGFDDLDEIPF
jgi:hypothetical protein